MLVGKEPTFLDLDNIRKAVAMSICLIAYVRTYVRCVAKERNIRRVDLSITGEKTSSHLCQSRETMVLKNQSRLISVNLVIFI